MKIETKQSFLRNEPYSLTGNEPTTLWIIPQTTREFHKRIKLKLLEVKLITVRAKAGIEPATLRTQSANRTTRPLSLTVIQGKQPSMLSQESNSRPRAPKARIIVLDHWALRWCRVRSNVFIIKWVKFSEKVLRGTEQKARFKNIFGNWKMLSHFFYILIARSKDSPNTVFLA